VEPEDQALLADSVGLALLVVLDALPPAERLALVLHDLFAVPFDQIGPMVGRSPAARGGDLQALVAVLDPEIVLRSDHGTLPGQDHRDRRVRRSAPDRRTRPRVPRRPVRLSGRRCTAWSTGPPPGRCRRGLIG
jgi:RNA polymerase sigma-70 factor (ECF subfamily)